MTDTTLEDIIAFLINSDIWGVKVTYNGYGDSGMIEEINFDRKGKTLSPNNLEEITGKPMTTLVSIIEDEVYNLLSRYHGGWEINEGSYGEFYFDLSRLKLHNKHCDRLYKDKSIHTEDLEQIKEFKPILDELKEILKEEFDGKEVELRVQEDWEDMIVDGEHIAFKDNELDLLIQELWDRLLEGRVRYLLCNKKDAQLFQIHIIKSRDNEMSIEVLFCWEEVQGDEYEWDIGELSC